MPSLLDKYPLSERYQERAEGNLPYGSTAGGEVTNPRLAATETQHVKADSGVLGHVNIQGQFELNPLGSMAAGQTAYNTGIGWFFDIDPTAGPRFSIGDSGAGQPKLLWDGDELVIVGSITADDGEIGGWEIGASQLEGGDVVLDSSGVITVGDGDNVAVLSSVDPTYRLWAGDAAGVDAPFSVTQEGALKAISGEIGGWEIGATTLTGSNVVLDSANGVIRAGASSYVTGTGWVLDYNSGTPRFRVGTTTGDRIQWDGSSLTVRGRIEFGTDDYLDDNIIHFGVSAADERLMEVIHASWPDSEVTINGGINNSNGAPVLEIEARDDDAGNRSSVTVRGGSDANTRIELRSVGGGNTALMTIQADAGRLQLTGFDSVGSAGSLTEYWRVSFGGQTRLIPLYSS